MATYPENDATFRTLLEFAQSCSTDVVDAFIDDVNDADYPEDVNEFMTQHTDEFNVYKLDILDDVLEREHTTEESRKLEFIINNLDSWLVPMFTYDEYLAA